jgi:hypothetical protein
MKGDLQDLYNQVFDLQVPEYYGGNLVAPMTSGYEEALASLYGFSQPGGIGDVVPSTFVGAGMPGTEGVGLGMDYLSQMAGGGAPTYTFDQDLFEQTLSNLMPTVQGDYDAAMRDPIREFEEITIPGINVGASMGGDAWGTMPQQQGAIAARGLDDRAADTWSGLYSNAVNQAQAAGYGAGVENLNATQQFNQDMLGGYQSFANLGGDYIGSGFDTGLSAMDPAMVAGLTDLTYDQSVIDADKAKWDWEQQAPWDYQYMQQSMLPTFGNALGAPLPSGFGTGGQSSAAGALEGLWAGLGLYGMGHDQGWWGNEGQT